MWSLLFVAIAYLLPQTARSGSTFAVSACASSALSSIYAYFDPTALACFQCSTGAAAKLVASNTTRDVLGMAETCECLAGYATTNPACDPSAFTGCPAATCVDCLTLGLVDSASNISTCVPCGASTTGIDAALNDCGCTTATSGGVTTSAYALVERTATGEWLNSKECVACPARSRAFYTSIAGKITADRYTCQSCSDPYASMSTTGDCVCDAGYRSVGVTGLFTGAAINCVPNSAVSTIAASYAESSAILVNFYSVQLSVSGDASSSVTGKSSKYFQHYYLWAAVGCLTYRPGSSTAPCQTLANLCVMQQLSPTATVCMLYTALATARRSSIHSFQSWPTSLPMLNYGTESSTSILADAVLSKAMSFDATKESGTSDTIQVYVVKTALNGTLLGVDKLTNHLQYCGTTKGASSFSVPSWLRFGYGYAETFTCDLKGLLYSTEARDPVFYDLYIRDLQADASVIASQTSSSSFKMPVTLYPVPVAIVNYRAADGSYPNKNSAWTGETNDYYTRRFTLVDAATGVTNVGEPAEVIRYASDIRLSFRARRADGASSGRPKYLSPPLLTITYKERLASSILNDADAGSRNAAGFSSDVVSFNVEYITDNADYGRTVLGMAVALGMLVVAWTLVRVVKWVRRNARTPFEAQFALIHLVKTLQYLITSFAPAFFWFLWVMTLYWLVFFKLQTAVFCLLPGVRPNFSDNEYIPFAAGLITIFVCYLLRILEAIYYQVTLDLFFIDWEKPRGALIRTGQDHEAGLGKSGVTPGLPGAAITAARFAPISVWRMLHVANEWAEMQTVRRLNLPLVLVILVCILEGGRLKYVATPQPDPYDLSAGEINPILQFANNIFWFLVVAGIHLTYTVALGERYINENPSSSFIDLCTVAKVSLLLVDDKYHGYYVHANAPHEHADGEMRELTEHLYEEGAAMRVGRGLPGCPDPNCQTFELHLPAVWREMYDRVFRRLVDSESAAVEAMTAVPGRGLLRFGGGGLIGNTPTSPGSLPGTPNAPTSISAMSDLAKAKERTKRLAGAFSALTTFLKGFIEETDPDYKRVWRERTMVQQILDLPPDMLTEAVVAGGPATGTTGKTTYMMLDKTYRFERAIFRGIELDLLVFDMLMFCLTDYSVQSPTIAAVVTYLVSQSLAWIRTYFGERNITYKTLIDGRFLR